MVWCRYASSSVDEEGLAKYTCMAQNGKRRRGNDVPPSLPRRSLCVVAMIPFSD